MTSEQAFENMMEPIPDWMWGSSVEARNALQNSGRVHPYTCRNDRTDAIHKEYQKIHGGDFGQLIAVEGGWECPACGYTQPLNKHEHVLPDT